MANKNTPKREPRKAPTQKKKQPVNRAALNKAAVKPATPAPAEPAATELPKASPEASATPATGFIGFQDYWNQPGGWQRTFITKVYVDGWFSTRGNATAADAAVLTQDEVDAVKKRQETITSHWMRSDVSFVPVGGDLPPLPAHTPEKPAVIKDPAVSQVQTKTQSYEPTKPPVSEMAWSKPIRTPSTPTGSASGMSHGSSQTRTYAPPPPPAPKPARSADLKHMPLEVRVGPFVVLRAKVFGGPYRDRPLTIDDRPVTGVKMAEEITAPCEIDVPTRDFDVPNAYSAGKALVRAVDALESGKTYLYVGCMGGTGRTGLFMALLAKALGVGKEGVLEKDWSGRSKGPLDPYVAHVRATYKAHAVETEQQKKYVETFKMPDELHNVRTRLFWRWVFRGFRA